MYTFTKLRDRRMPNVGVGVRVGVGPVEFQLDALKVRSHRISRLCMALHPVEKRRRRAVPYRAAPDPV